MLAIGTADLIRSAGGRLEPKDEEVDRSDSIDSPRGRNDCWAEEWVIGVGRLTSPARLIVNFPDQFWGERFVLEIGMGNLICSERGRPEQKDEEVDRSDSIDGHRRRNGGWAEEWVVGVGLLTSPARLIANFP